MYDGEGGVRIDRYLVNGDMKFGWLVSGEVGVLMLLLVKRTQRLSLQRRLVVHGGGCSGLKCAR